jgi:hypothetical protein
MITKDTLEIARYALKIHTLDDFSKCQPGDYYGYDSYGCQNHHCGHGDRRCSCSGGWNNGEPIYRIPKNGFTEHEMKKFVAITTLYEEGEYTGDWKALVELL